MLNERLAAAHNVVGPLHATKDAARSTLLQAAELTTAILKGSQDAKIPIALCAKALHEIAQGNVAAAAALVHFAEAHAELATVRDQIGLGTRMAGDWWDTAKPKESAPVPALKAVS
jgi:ABC-type cobalamin/Fe3+-siderophores transport system ATPase subunit